MELAARRSVAIKKNVNPVDYGAACKVLALSQASATTIANYQRHVKHFLAFVQKSGLNIESVLDFKKHLAGRNDLAIGSKNQFLNVAKVYCAALYALGVVPADLSKDITGKPVRGFRDSRLHKKDGFAPAEYSTLKSRLAALSLPQHAGDFAGQRIRAIFTLLLTQGLRSSELLALDVEKIDFGRRTAWIRGKGRDAAERISLTEHSAAALESWLQTANIRSGAVFVNARGGRLSRSGLKKITRQTLEGWGIFGRSAHTFRHTFVDLLVSSERYKGRYDQIRQFTRHKSIDMIAVYASELDLAAEQPHFSEVFSRSGLASK